MVIIMSMKKKITMEIDWDALDSGWAKMYEEDYGTQFFNNSHISAHLQLSDLATIEAGH